MDIYRCERAHAEQVTALALAVYDGLARLGLHALEHPERELLWAAGMLHDAGVLVDYNDHHKHGFYLVLNAGLPGFRHRELALVALLVRSHRKALPTPAPLEGVLGVDDAERLMRLAACLRVAEQLERGRAGGIREVRMEAPDGTVRLAVRAEGDPAVALWSAALEAPIFDACLRPQARTGGGRLGARPCPAGRGQERLAQVDPRPGARDAGAVDAGAEGDQHGRRARVSARAASTSPVETASPAILIGIIIGAKGGSSDSGRTHHDSRSPAEKVEAR